MATQQAQRTQSQTQPPAMTRPNDDDETEIDVDDDVDDLDPDSIVTLNIMDRHNAGRKPSTRWGRVQFNEIGEATIKVPVRDVHLVHNLKWLSEDDQKRYLHLEEAQPATPAENASNAELEAVRGANTRLAQRNAELEEKLDSQAKEFKTQFKAYQEGTQKEIEVHKAKRKEAEDALQALEARKSKAGKGA